MIIIFELKWFQSYFNNYNYFISLNLFLKLKQTFPLLLLLSSPFIQTGKHGEKHTLDLLSSFSIFSLSFHSVFFAISFSFSFLFLFIFISPQCPIPRRVFFFPLASQLDGKKHIKPEGDRWETSFEPRSNVKKIWSNQKTFQWITTFHSASHDEDSHLLSMEVSFLKFNMGSSSPFFYFFFFEWAG